MNIKAIPVLGLILVVISQLLMSFGFEFLQNQEPIDFAHWSLLLGALALFTLWFQLPQHATKHIGLTVMTLGIGGVVGMCTIDLVLFAARDNPELRGEMLDVVLNSPLLQLSFLVVGPSLFYAGLCIATYGLFTRFKWQVALLNTGGMMIGLGFMVFHNHFIPFIGSVLLLVGMSALIFAGKKEHLA